MTEKRGGREAPTGVPDNRGTLTASHQRRKPKGAGVAVMRRREWREKEKEDGIACAPVPVDNRAFVAAR